MPNFLVIWRLCQVLVSSIEIDPAAVLVPVAYLFDTLCIYIYIYGFSFVVFLLNVVIIYFDACIKISLINLGSAAVLVPVVYFFDMLSLNSSINLNHGWRLS